MTDVDANLIHESGQSSLTADALSASGIEVLRLNLLDLISTPLIGRGHRGRMIRKGLHDAATALDVLRAEIARKDEALEPFANYANRVSHSDEISRRHCEDEGRSFRPSRDNEGVVAGYITLGHCRAALRAREAQP